MKVIKLSALRTGRLYDPGNIPGAHFLLEAESPQGHSQKDYDNEKFHRESNPKLYSR